VKPNTHVVHPVRARILEYIRVCPHSPSLREIAAHLGISAPSTVRRHLLELERAGLVGFAGPDHRVYAVRQPTASARDDENRLEAPAEDTHQANGEKTVVSAGDGEAEATSSSTGDLEPGCSRRLLNEGDASDRLLGAGGRSRAPSPSLSSGEPDLLGGEDEPPQDRLWVSG
jgi:hypothetical protein